MSTKRSRLLARKLPDALVTVDRSPMADVALSPTSPLERNLRSPKGWKNRESDGVGLGIVAALQKIGGGDASSKVIVGAPNLSASAPISIAASRGSIGKSELGFTRPSRVDEEFPAFRTADFLSHCCLCSKRLHGKDIYMYRGEKAFCSTECRFRQIVSDEFQEKCGPKASKPSDISSSPYSSGGRLFFTAIAAA